MFIWSTKDWISKEHKNSRLNVDFDHASLICWSPDSKAFVINRASDNVVEVYKVSKKTDGWISSITKAITFPQVTLFNVYSCFGLFTESMYQQDNSVEKSGIIRKSLNDQLGSNQNIDQVVHKSE